jgi:hypothetical protein
MTRIRQLGEATVQQHMDGGAVKLSTFIPLHEPDLVPAQPVAAGLDRAAAGGRRVRCVAV